jgi:hypothetical protein
LSPAPEFASTLDSQVASALQSAKISSANLTGAAESLNNAWQRAHGTPSGPVESAFAGLVTSLYKVYGSTSTAKGIADAYGRQMGMTAGQIRNLNGWIDSLIGHLNSIPRNVTTTVTTNFVNTGQPQSGILPTPSGHYQNPGGFAAFQGLPSGSNAPMGRITGPSLGPRFPVDFGWGPPSLPHSTNPRTGSAQGSGSGVPLHHHIRIYLGGAKIQSAERTQILSYARRNPSNNWALRTR